MPIKIIVSANLGDTIPSLQKVTNYLAAMGTTGGQAMQQLSNHMEMLQKQLKDTKATEAQRKAFADLAVEARALKGHLLAVGQMSVADADQVSRLTEKIKAQSDALKVSTGPFTVFNKNLMGIASSLSRFRYLIGLTTAAVGFLVGGLGVAIHAFAQLELELARIKAVTGASEQSISKLKERAKELASTSMYSSVEIAKGMKFLAIAGYDTQEVLNSISSVIALATVEGMDMEKATRVLTGTLRAFNLETTKSAYVANALMLVSNRTNSTVEELGYAMSYVAPIANQLGIKLNELAAALGVVSNSNIRGTIAGTAFRRILSQVGNTSSESGRKLLDYAMATGKTIDFMDSSTGTITSFADMIDYVSEMSIPQLLGIFEVRALPALLALETAGADAMRVLASEIDATSDAAADAARIINETLLGSWEHAKNSMNNLAESFSYGSWAVTQFNDKLASLAQFMATNPNIGTMLAGGVGAAISGFALKRAIVTGGSRAIPYVGTALSIGALAGGLYGSLTSPPEETRSVMEERDQLIKAAERQQQEMRGVTDDAELVQRYNNLVGLQRRMAELRTTMAANPELYPKTGILETDFQKTVKAYDDMTKTLQEFEGRVNSVNTAQTRAIQTRLVDLSNVAAYGDAMAATAERANTMTDAIEATARAIHKDFGTDAIRGDIEQIYEMRHSLEAFTQYKDIPTFKTAMAGIANAGSPSAVIDQLIRYKENLAVMQAMASGQSGENPEDRIQGEIETARRKSELTLRYNEVVARARERDAAAAAREAARLAALDAKRLDLIDNITLFTMRQNTETRDLATITAELTSKQEELNRVMYVLGNTVIRDDATMEQYSDSVALLKTRIEKLNQEQSRRLTLNTAEARAQEALNDALETADEALGGEHYRLQELARLRTNRGTFRGELEQARTVARDKYNDPAATTDEKREAQEDLTKATQKFLAVEQKLMNTENKEVQEWKRSHQEMIFVLSGVQNQFNAFFQNVIAGSGSMEARFGAAMESMKQALLDFIAVVMAKMAFVLLLNAITGGSASAFEAFGVSGVAKLLGLGKANGGPIRGYANGGYIPAGDNTLIGARYGEYVLNERTTRRIGITNLDRVNSGGGNNLADASVNMPITIAATPNDEELAERLMVGAKRVVRRHLKPMIADILNGER